jgi:galactofuranose transport system substrate-binding protein
VVKPLRRALLACAVLTAAGAGRPAVAARPLVIGYSQAGADPDWRDALRSSIKAAAARDGITVKFADAGPLREHPQADRLADQLKVIRAFITQQVDVIAFSPASETGWDAVLREARAANIPVIIVGPAIATERASLYTAVIGPDFTGQGRRAGRWLATRAARAPGPALNIVELRGDPGSSATSARSNGFAQAIASTSRLNMLCSRVADKDTMHALLQRHGKTIGAVFAHHDELALGAIQAIEEAGLAPGRDIVVMAVGGGKAALDAMAAGKLNMVVECGAQLGSQLMQVARDVAARRRVPHWVQTEDVVLTADGNAERR